MIPNRVRISEWSTGRLRYLKSKTGLTPNIIARFAFTLSVRDAKPLIKLDATLDGQEFNAPTLFGEHQRLYEVLLIRYLRATEDDRLSGTIIAHHIDAGLHKMGHIRSLSDLVELH